jgi:hypothetical protein
MNRPRVVLFGSVVAAALVAGGIIGATASGFALTPVKAAIFAAASPSATFKSNETPSHESGESASQEAAENNGTFHPGGPGGGPGPNGMSNETPAHEAGESASREASEKS